MLKDVVSCREDLGRPSLATLHPDLDGIQWMRNTGPCNTRRDTCQEIYLREIQHGLGVSLRILF